MRSAIERKTFFDSENDRRIEGVEELSMIEKIMHQLGLIDILPKEFDPDAPVHRAAGMFYMKKDDTL